MRHESFDSHPNSIMRRVVLGIFSRAMIASSLLLTPINSLAEESDLRTKVSSLLADLDATDPTDRDAAEAELKKLGHAALPYLPKEDDRDLNAEQKLRLSRIIPLLWNSKAKASVDGSTISIENEEMLLSDFLTRFQESSGNKFIDLRPDLKQEIDDPTVRVAKGSQPFWRTLDETMGKAGFVLYPNQPNRTIGFAHGAPVASPVFYSGAFRFRLDRVIARRDFGLANEVPSCQFDITLQVEPRLHPIQIQLVGDQCRATGSDKSALEYLGPKRAFMTFEDDSIQLTLPLRFQSPPRSVESAREIKGVLDVLLPSQKALFSFDDLSKSKETTKNDAGIAVTLREFDTSEEGVWAARFVVERKTAERETESYLQTELKNELFLEASDGRRVIQDGGMNSQDLGDGRTEYEYLFVDVPGTPLDYKLILHVPAGLVRAPVNFEFTNIPLP